MLLHTFIRQFRDTTAGNTAGEADLTILTDMMGLFSIGIVALGGIYCIIGMMSIARGYKDHAGADMNTGISQIVSGGIYILAAAFVKTITLQ